MAFKKIEAQQLQGNPFEMIEKQAALFTAGTPGDFNTMTIGWGCMGDLWSVPAFVAYVRHSRYTPVSYTHLDVYKRQPYALAQAESMSNVVMDVTPNMIFVIGNDMRILDCNRKGQELLGVGHEEAVQRYIFEFIEAEDIENALLTREPVLHKKVHLENGRMVAEETIVYIENLDAVLVTYQDVTREEKIKEQHYNLKVETVEMAQKVIEKQMMVAQEIAGLLGETTAETKVTLTKLRDSILNDEE